MQKFVTVYFSLDIIQEHCKSDMIKTSFTKLTDYHYDYCYNIPVIIMTILKKKEFLRMNF